MTDEPKTETPNETDREDSRDAFIAAAMQSEELLMRLTSFCGGYPTVAVAIAAQALALDTALRVPNPAAFKPWVEDAAAKLLNDIYARRAGAH